MHVKSLITELHWHMLYRAGANYSQVVYGIPFIYDNSTGANSTVHVEL